MRERWRIDLMGTPGIRYGDAAVIRLQNPKADALLAYLAFYRQRSHTREELVALFWPEADSDSGRNRLSLALARLRQRLGAEGDAFASLLVVDLVCRKIRYLTNIAIFQQICIKRLQEEGTVVLCSEHLPTRLGYVPGRVLLSGVAASCPARKAGGAKGIYLNKAKAENQEVSRSARREMSRHSVDCGEVQISASHGVIHLHGRIRPMRGHEEGFDQAVAGLLKALRQRMGIRDVITEWTVVS